MICTANYIRGQFKIEQGATDIVLERHSLDYQKGRLTEVFGDTLVSDWDLNPTTHPEIDDVRMIIAYAVAAEVMRIERVVATGFGTVVKKDEYSEQAGEDMTRRQAQAYAAECSARMRRLAKSLGVYYEWAALGGIEEQFFSKKR